MIRDNSNVTHCVFYRMGGTLKFTWKRSIPDTKRNSEIRRDALRKAGYASILAPITAEAPVTFEGEPLKTQLKRMRDERARRVRS